MPVIFLPGVMGSLLAKTDTGDEAFFAPNMDNVGSAIGGLMSVIVGWFRSAASRETRFDPLMAQVTPLGPINVGKGTIIDEKEARRRGWGSVHRWSYHPILLWLEEHLNEPMALGKLKGPWIEADKSGEKWALHPVIGTDPTQYGSCTPGPGPIAADSEEFKKFASFRYRVYAIGYNWLQSNDTSGADVVTGLDYKDPQTKKTARLMGIKEICAENHTGKAIVLTHSMGGLVARFAVLKHDAEGLLHGVFHNVQPATGAPLAAKRFRTGGGSEAGMDGFVNGSLLGRDAPEFVAVAANAPGPLELLPMPDYNDGDPWWIFSRLNGDVKLKLPKAKGNAYNEIYLNASWYGAQPPEDQLDPAGVVKSRLSKSDIAQTVLSNYKQTLEKVVTRQNELASQYHSNTYVTYGSGALPSKTTNTTSLDSAIAANSDRRPVVEKGESAEKLLTWGTVIWTSDDLPADITEDELINSTLLHDSHKGDLRVRIENRNLIVSFTVQKTKKLPPLNRDNGMIPGDGTVPVWSAEAQARGLKQGVRGETAQGVKMAFVQGGYEHQFSYEHPWTRWALLYSLVQIVKDVPIPGCQS